MPDTKLRGIRMIREFEAGEFISTLLKNEVTESISYNKLNLRKLATQIEEKHPDVRIDMGECSINRFGMQCDNIIVTSSQIIINKRMSLTTRCIIAHNLPSREVQTMFRTANSPCKQIVK